MYRPMTLLSVVALLSTCFIPSQGYLPGFKLRLSKKGLDYANVVVQETLEKELRNIHLPDFHGRKGNYHFSITSIQNRRVIMPSSSIAFVQNPNGLSCTISDLGINFHADWFVKYQYGWFKVKDYGSFDLNMREVSLSVTVSLGTQSGGRPSLNVESCDESIGDVYIRVHGSTAWIWNMFRGYLIDKGRDMIRGEICDIVKKAVDDDANEKLKQFKVLVAVDDHFLLDYHLVSTPAVHTNYLETHHKGEVFMTGKRKEVPFSPTAIPALYEERSMMYLWITEYVAKTFAFSAQDNKFLQYTITDKDFPSSIAPFLNTTCRGMCVGKLIPQIGRRFPNAELEARVKSLNTPDLSISPKGINMTGDVMSEIWAKTKNNKEYYVITLRVKFAFTVKGSVVNERLTGKITDHSVQVSVMKSAISEVNNCVDTFLVNSAISVAVIPKINALMAEGLDLPVTGVVDFYNTRIHLLDHCVLIATDIRLN